MKGGRQAKLLAKEEQAKKRAEKVFNAFSKESLKKLKLKLMPEEAKTPTLDMQTGYNFTESTDASPGVKANQSMNKTLGRKGRLISESHKQDFMEYTLKFMT